MKKVLLLLFVLGTVVAIAQPRKVLRITHDSLAFEVVNNWLFCNDDSAKMAASSYNDNAWKFQEPQLFVYKTQKPLFDGVCWFRLHFYIDSTLLDSSLAFTFLQMGASEVYLDGKLKNRYGLIQGKESSIYCNPQYDPTLLTFTDTGEHVLAIRYANYNAEKNNTKYGEQIAGFSLNIYHTSHFMHYGQTLFLERSIFMFLFCFFSTIAMVHFLLFLYYRKELSNLYFSIFALCIGLQFFYLLSQVSYANPSTVLLFKRLVIPITCLACFALSGVINSVFPDKRKTRFYIISVFALVVVLLTFFSDYFDEILIVSLIGLATLETFVKIVVAIIKKREGSRIIGFGFFLFTVFMLVIAVAVITVGNFYINSDDPWGPLLLAALILSCLAIPISMSTYLAKSFATVSKDLRKQLGQVKLLSDKTLEQEQEKQRLLENRKEELEKEVQLRTIEVITQKDKIEKQHSELVLEKKKSDDLLLNILPSEVAEELKLNGASEARYFTDVTVLFTDFVNFTKVSEQLSPQELVSEIHGYFRVFDEIIGQFGLEKIKTIGDAYLAVCGLPEPNTNHAVNTVKAAIAIRDYILERKEKGGLFEIRLGLNSGPVVAGIVGVKKFAYDIWGDTVNTAARMEQHSEAGKINISGSTYELVSNDFQFINRGKIDAKNKGMIDMYFVDGFLAISG